MQGATNGDASVPASQAISDAKPREMIFAVMEAIRASIRRIWKWRSDSIRFKFP